MTYYISRSGQQYGPYSEADLQNMLSQGQIAATDSAWGEGMAAWTPVSEILSKGSAPAQPQQQPPTQYEPPPLPAQPQHSPQGGYAGGAPPVAGYGAPAYAGGYPQQPVAGPMPPSLHWALLLLLCVVTSIFGLVWIFVQSSFVKKIDPRSKATMWFVVYLVSYLVALGLFVYFVVDILREFPDLLDRLRSSTMADEYIRHIWETIASSKLALLFAGLGIVCLNWIFLIVGFFSERNSIQRYYNSVEPIGLRLSGVMTFFFNIFYFQYHFSRIERWKRTGQLY